MIYKPCYFGLKISLQTKQITVKCLKWKLLLIDIIIIKSQINKKSMNLLLSMLSMTPLLLLVKTPMRQHKIEKNQWWWNMMNYVWSGLIFSWIWPYPMKSVITKNHPDYSDYSYLWLIFVSIQKDMRKCSLAGWALFIFQVWFSWECRNIIRPEFCRSLVLSSSPI